MCLLRCVRGVYATLVPTSKSRAVCTWHGFCDVCCACVHAALVSGPGGLFGGGSVWRALVDSKDAQEGP